MRPASILIAAVVMLALYALVFERERVLALSGRDPEGQAAVAADAPAAALVRDSASPDEGERRVPVVTLRSEAREVENAVRVRGQTEAARMVEVRAQTQGLIATEPLRRGAAIEAGDLLCRLDPGTREIQLADAQARLEEARARVPEGEARLAEAQARLAEAEVEDRAARRLSEGGFAADTRVTSAQATVEAARAGIQSAQAGVQAARSGIQSAEAGVAAARDEIARLEIRAPFGGLLESDTAELGTLLQPGELCATVIRLDPIKLVGFIPETEVETVSVGAPAGARLATGREVQGRVVFLSRSADEVTRTFRIEVEVANDDLSIGDGQTAEILIQGRPAVAHLLPQSAMTLDDDGRLGFRLAEDGRAAFAPVEILRDTREGIYVAGLPAVADVIVVGQEFVTDGVLLDATPRTAAP